MIRYVVFDFDDTLYDTNLYFISAFEAISSYLADKFKIDKGMIRSRLLKTLKEKGPSYTKLFDDTLRHFNIHSGSTVKKLVEIFYAAPTSSIKLYNDAKIFIDMLKSKGCVLILMTDGSFVKQGRRIGALRLDQTMDYILYCNDLGYKKPSYRLYEHLLKFLKCLPQDILVVGDRPTDYIGAKGFGIASARILRGEYKKIKLGKYEADFTVDSLVDLFSIKELRFG
ncbi:MAG: HAD hydrolase-like protein [Candidatus Aenigmarchaeota archaeon]|nr:HAD hydrolase-like protein [Candidatus Aenigmarchaeota archaeon]